MSSQAPLDDRSATATAADVLSRLLAAALCLAVVAVHIVDQGGLIGDKAPRYVGVGYWVLEVVGVVVAGLLLAGRARRQVWGAAALVGVGPFVGYVLSRGPGLPGYTDDRGNWTEQIGHVSLAVEVLLVVLALAQLARLRAAAS